MCSPMVTRNDRIWPIGGGTSVDLPQSSAYGSKQYFTKYEQYMTFFHNVILYYRETRKGNTFMYLIHSDRTSHNMFCTI